jgi:hypothetical protein
VRATLGLRPLLDGGLIGGIVVAANQNYDGVTVWIAAISPSREYMEIFGCRGLGGTGMSERTELILD